MKKNAFTRRGFTLVELLVVIAIIGILIGMLLPAVQSVREAARRTTCQNNVKQMSLAFHIHHDALGLFPDGGKNWFDFNRSVTESGNPQVAPKQNWGFFYQILPYIEQANLYDITMTNRAAADNIIRATPVDTFHCASRRKTTIKVGRFASNDYAGNGGMIRGGPPGWGNGELGGAVVRATHATPVTMASFTDGTSNSIVVGEKAVNPIYYDALGCADNEGWAVGWDWDTIRWGIPNRSPIPDREAVNCETRFGSNHPGGTNFGRGDGSVHFAAHGVDADSFNQAIHISDGFSGSLD